ncbi:hypothetical protein [Croceibacter atlanticus]|uniref:hypothetical protein n=1 Tax=Croceibacter atlanticus TaxID=313588 RepID=UPI0030D846CF|tara:strand:+ start:42110 stop:42274 length:165 start_codon:yes stop_codon:yes gene_type:complete
MVVEGRIIIKYEKLGFIQYDLDKRISYLVKNYNAFELGDIIAVTFTKPDGSYAY